MPQRNGALPSLEVGNKLGTKSGVGKAILGLDSHKGSRIIKHLAEACGSRTHTALRPAEFLATAAFAALAVTPWAQRRVCGLDYPFSISLKIARA